MSATQDETLFKRAFPEAHPQNLPSTAWQPHVKVYQLRTNRNPRAAVYRFADGEAVGLSDTGENYWQRMIDEIARTPDTKHAIITYKDVLKWKLNDEASDLSELDNIIATAHYGNHRVGFDTDFQDPDHLCILFAPELPITKLYGEEACLFSLAMFCLVFLLGHFCGLLRRFPADCLGSLIGCFCGFLRISRLTSPIIELTFMSKKSRKKETIHA